MLARREDARAHREHLHVDEYYRDLSASGADACICDAVAGEGKVRVVEVDGELGVTHVFDAQANIAMVNGVALVCTLAVEPLELKYVRGPTGLTTRYQRRSLLVRRAVVRGLTPDPRPVRRSRSRSRRPVRTRRSLVLKPSGSDDGPAAPPGLTSRTPVKGTEAGVCMGVAAARFRTSRPPPPARARSRCAGPGSDGCRRARRRS